jgi:hypothetical protein
MKPTLRLAAVAVVVALGGVLGVGARRAEAQVGVPYGPYSMPRPQFNRYAPGYYPRLYNNWGVTYYSRRPLYYIHDGRPGFNHGWRVSPTPPPYVYNNVPAQQGRAMALPGAAVGALRPAPEPKVITPQQPAGTATRP